MDKSDQNTTTEGPRDKPITPADSTHNPDQSMLEADGVNSSTRVASLPPQSPRTQPARLLSMVHDPPPPAEEDVEMTAPPTPRPRPASLPQAIATIERGDRQNESIRTPATPASPSRASRLPALPPGRIDGLDFERARRYLKRALALDSNGRYNQALEQYNKAHTLYRPALNSITMSSGSRKALERTLAPHQERVVDLEDAQVYDETEPDRFMVDPSRVPPLSGRGVGGDFAFPGMPASMVRPALIGDGPAVDAENGVDQYLLELQKLYGRDSRARPRSRPDSAPMARESNTRSRGSTPTVRQLTPAVRESTPMWRVWRESTPVPSVERRDSAPTPQTAPARMDPSEEVESIREREDTPLPGNVENFENRHPKRGLVTYGSVHGAEGRMRQFKRPKIMYDPKGVLGAPASKSIDMQMAKMRQEEANDSHWMQDFFWNHRSKLHGELAKDKWRDLRERRERLGQWERELLDQEEEDEGFEEGWEPSRDSSEPREALDQEEEKDEVLEEDREPHRDSSETPSIIYECGNCGAGTRTDGALLYLCVGCRETYYCSMECQEEQSDVHRSYCLLRRQEKHERMKRRVQQSLREEDGIEMSLERVGDPRDLRFAVKDDQAAEDIDRMLQQPVATRSELESAFMSDEIDLDEYTKRAVQRSQAERNDSVSTPGSDRTGRRSPRTPEDVDLQGVGGAFDIQFVDENLSTMRETLGSWRQQATLSPVTKRPKLIIRPPKPPGRSEEEILTAQFDRDDDDSDEDAEHESDDDMDIQMSGKKPLELLTQGQMYPKLITDFRIEMNGGRTLEYLVSDARREKEWCKAGTLLGPSWTTAIEAF
ncbi:hypothetical protein PRZ48_000978 [Zasmidium cellare]|uniref:MYND-type domain-containing protein n=1 Tax=Zasmidium cellare TaxID=395010 RepID=A0ABR0F1A6_ZASCE|nr:hypothetical protein PRZ48_000978 [Zasmidium cellare]